MSNAILHEHALGLSWTIDEPMERSSHALADGDRVWLIDPVDDPVAIERVSHLGAVAGVIQLLDRHNRDSAKLAARFGVEHFVNPVSVPGTPFELRPLINLRMPKWRETVLWWPEPRALVVSEAVGTGRHFTGGDDCGIHLMLRPFPPKKRLRGYEPEHLLVGHGPPLHGSVANEGLRRALRRSRRDTPKALIGAFRGG